MSCQSVCSIALRLGAMPDSARPGSPQSGYK
jgi:hypothetical protein